jgi:hypothetical protein
MVNGMLPTVGSRLTNKPLHLAFRDSVRALVSPRSPSRSVTVILDRVALITPHRSRFRGPASLRVAARRASPPETRVLRGCRLCKAGSPLRVDKPERKVALVVAFARLDQDQV